MSATYGVSRSRGNVRPVRTKQTSRRSEEPLAGDELLGCGLVGGSLCLCRGERSKNEGVAAVGSSEKKQWLDEEKGTIIDATRAVKNFGSPQVALSPSPSPSPSLLSPFPRVLPACSASCRSLAGGRMM